MQQPPESPPAILLMGPTASGKTAVAAHLAQRFPVEIVSVDSAQVFRGMDIGTAKPGPELLRRAPHHLIDIIDPTERYSAAQFVDDASELMAQITGQGRIPLLTGGTMLYFKALREGLSSLPPADPDVRLVIDGMAEESGWPALHAELARVDPVTAARLEPADAQRIQRALEMYYLTGETLSALIARGRSAPPPYRLIPLALEPSDRSVLHQRIAQRFEVMLELGLIGEVRRLRESYALDRIAAVHAGGRLPAGLAISRRRAGAGGVAREGHRGHPPTGQAPAHLAARDAGSQSIRLPRRRPRRAGNRLRLLGYLRPAANRSTTKTRRHQSAESAAMPASAICASCCEVTPLTPIAPITCSPVLIGTPPSRRTASALMLTIDGRVLARSSNTLVGRLNAIAVCALPMATSMLPVWVPSMRCR